MGGKEGVVGGGRSLEVLVRGDEGMRKVWYMGSRFRIRVVIEGCEGKEWGG